MRLVGRASGLEQLSQLVEVATALFGFGFDGWCFEPYGCRIDAGILGSELVELVLAKLGRIRQTRPVQPKVGQPVRDPNSSPGPRRGQRMS